MAGIEISSDPGSFVNALSAAEAKAQFQALSDLTRQVVGDATANPGSAAATDPLNAPYILYVNPYTGNDAFVSGTYNSFEGGANDTEVLANKQRRLEKQRLTCGYSPQRPFKTVNRAAIEVALITSKAYLEKPEGGAYEGDLCSIVLAPGLIDILNGAGSAVTEEWVGGKQPTAAELQAFNADDGGLILPRGCSVCCWDLRKCVIRPTAVPAPADEAADLSNRRSIFKMTGGGYYFGMTFKDKKDADSSHHLLQSFGFASEADLDQFYAKIRTAFGGASNTGGISGTLAVKRSSEFQIVGQFPADGAQTISSDTTKGSSPYIYNCSVRSEWGLCGELLDGSEVNGLKSGVLAQFTGVSLQRDLSCWQKYSGGSWTSFSDYQDYINASPDDTRMDPNKRSFHVRAVDNAIAQEVSVFAIGQGVHHWTQAGGELTITNSNSNFGGCAALSEGYRTAAFANDSDWSISRLRVATDLTEKNGNVVKIYIGNVANDASDSLINQASEIPLRFALEESILEPGQPKVLVDRKYTFRENSYLWIENPIGEDYRTRLPANAWDVNSPDKIKIVDNIINENGIAPGDPILTSGGVETGQQYPPLAGRRVYIRRVRDTRTTGERRYALICNNSKADSRLPVRDYVIQSPDSSIPDSAIIGVMQVGGEPSSGPGVARTSEVVVRRLNPPSPWTSGRFYRPGDNITLNNKHYICSKENDSNTFTPDEWAESFVHMEIEYNNEDFLPNAQPEIIFDNDTDGADSSTTLGYDFSTVWQTDARVINQYQTASDYLGVYSFLRSAGFSDGNARTILTPKPTAQRNRNPGAPLDSIPAPSGAYSGWDNWPIEFRRPSVIRLFGHAWEWAGYLNYTKALPRYQGELGSINRFTYYFTHQDGGRVYASGFNQEGFLVNNRGLEDLATGATLSVDQLGSDDFSIDFPTFYETLSVDNLAINTELLLGGRVVGRPVWEESGSNPYLDTVNKISMGPFGGPLPELPLSTQDQEGVLRLATPAEANAFVRDDIGISPATLIAALGDAVKSVVNARLSLSSVSSVPNADQGGSTLYMHPFNGNEVALYSTITNRWSVRRFPGVRAFSLAGASSANTVYDVYLYDASPTNPTTPSLQVEYVAWPGNQTEPARGLQDGVPVKAGDPTRRLMGVVRTTSAGNSVIDLGGTIPGANSANFPKLYLANLYNLYDASARYFFGTSWTNRSQPWTVAPASVYPTAPRVSLVQAGNTLVTAFLDIYHNDSTSKTICYVAPGINSQKPPSDAFYGECQSYNTTAGSQWSRALSPGLHEIFYLYKLFGGSGAETNVINEHPAHGLIVTAKA